MKAVKTETSNTVLKAPEDSTNVIDLPVTRLVYGDGTPAVESCWELNKKELEEINETGRIYFTCLGSTHPPILLSTSSVVFEEGD